jgi:hypothetical protein
VGCGLLGLLSVAVFAQPTPSDVANKANPATVYCAKQSGRWFSIHTPYGEAGYCLLPNKQVCEEWAFLNHKCPKPSANQSKSTLVKPKSGTNKPQYLALTSQAKPFKPRPFKSITLADGYRTLPVTDVHVIRMAKLAAQQLSRHQANVKTIIWAQRKKGSGQNYRMMISLTDGKQYSALVYQAPGNHPPLLREAKLVNR